MPGLYHAEEGGGRRQDYDKGRPQEQREAPACGEPPAEAGDHREAERGGEQGGNGRRGELRPLLAR